MHIVTVIRKYDDTISLTVKATENCELVLLSSASWLCSGYEVQVRLLLVLIK
jgi:hypothetical protein